MEILNNNLLKRSSLAIASAVLVYCSASAAQERTENAEAPKLSLEQVCDITKCRAATTVRLASDKEHYFEIDLPKAPIVFDESINIVAGETLFIEAGDSTGKLVNMKVVETVGSSATTLVLAFRQEKVKDKDGNSMMLLHIKNPYKKTLKYRADVHPAGKNQFYKTSVCPILPGLGSYESWPYPIVQLLLSDFELVEAKAREALRCK